MNSSKKRYESTVYAKINLVLSVGQSLRDADGQGAALHPICSWMHSINLCDQIQIERLDDECASSYSVVWNREAHIDGQSVSVRQEPVEWAMDDDLAVRAHKVVEAHIGRSLPIRLKVAKNIPAGGGLGGGSADAAGVLIGLNTLFGLGLNEAQLVELGMKIGSDVPFFLDLGHPIPRPAIVEETGERITRLESVHAGKPTTLFLMNFGCSTPAVYRAFDEMHNDSGHAIDTDRVRSIALRSDLDCSVLFNDLREPAIRVAQQLGVIRDRLVDSLGCPVHVSGSGSTLFCLGDSEFSRGGSSGENHPECQQVVYTQLC